MSEISYAPTIWCLDVDGVINAWAMPEDHPNRDEYTVTKVLGYTITYRQTVVDFVNEMSRREDIQVIWTTNWENSAKFDLAPSLGFDSFWAHHQSAWDGDWADSGERWWKRRRVNEHLAAGRKVVWTDDHIPESMLNDHQPGLLMIAPDDSIGLTDDHLETIRAFIEEGS